MGRGSAMLVLAGTLTGPLAATLIVVAPAPSSAQSLYIRNYTMNDGLPAAQIFTGFQDSGGYLWFGSPTGLARYDGATFEVFNTEVGMPHDAVRSIVEWRGALWLLGEHGVTRFADGAFTAYTSEQGLGEGIVWRGVIHQDALWLGTSRGGLTRFDGDRFERFTTADGLPGDNVFELYSSGETLWIGTRGGGLAAMRGRDVEVLDALPAQQVMALEELDGVLWIGTRDDGIWSYEDETLQQRVAGVKAYGVARRDEELFFGTLGQGVIRVRESGEVGRITTAQGLVGDRVYSVFVDREQTVWFTTSTGVSKLVSEAFRGYLPGTNVLSVSTLDDTVWAGTLGSGVVRIKGTEQQRLTVDDGLWSDTVWSLAADGARMWIGAADGLSVWERGKARKVVPIAGAPYDIMVRDGEPWISTNVGVCRLVNETCRYYTVSEGLASDVVYSGIAHGSSMCFATEGGVSCIQDEVVTNYDTEQGLPSTTAYSVASDAAGQLWVGTNRGLSYLQDGRFVAVGKEAGLKNRFVASLLSHQDEVVVGTSLGVHLLSEGRLKSHFDARSGMIGNELNFGSMYRADDGSLWLGTTTGLTHYLPELDRPNLTPPLVSIERGLAGDAPIRAGTRLEPGRYDVGFVFSASSFRDERDVWFRYALDGYDSDWSVPTRGRSVRYTNLRAGNYEFRVQAINGAGVVSERPARLPFVVLAAYWETWWFRVLVVLGLVFVGYLATRLRLVQARRRTEYLERVVAERTLQLRRANEELQTLALTDPLTRLRNRRFFKEMIDEEVARVRRYRGPGERRPRDDKAGIGFVVVDIDHFKEINDAHGHDAGDEVLKSVALALSGCTREVDWVVRWGGEEFLLVYKDVSETDLEMLASRVCERVRGFRIGLPDGSEVSRTCSVGFSRFPFTWQESDGMDYLEVLNLADRAMYLAKNHGRDAAIGLRAGESSPADEERERFREDLSFAIEEGFIDVVGAEPEH